MFLSLHNIYAYECVKRKKILFFYAILKTNKICYNIIKMWITFFKLFKNLRINKFKQFIKTMKKGATSSSIIFWAIFIAMALGGFAMLVVALGFIQ